MNDSDGREAQLTHTTFTYYSFITSLPVIVPACSHPLQVSRILLSLFGISRLQHCLANTSQRERSRSPRRRSRSPRRSRRSYSPRSRSRSRGDDYRRSERRSRSPMSGAQGASGGYSGSGYGGRGAPPPPRSFEDRAAAKEQMMTSVRESSQQDRRVYVGNLAYDVKWHHLKDFMRQGWMPLCTFLVQADQIVAGEVLFADVLLLPNGMSKVGAYV